MRSIRAGNSTKLARPLPSLGLFSWDGLSPVSFTVAPAGHPPGLYETVITGFIKVAAAAGTHNCTIEWDQPNFGPTSLLINFGALTATNPTGVLRFVRSSGLAPITFTWATVGLVGALDLELTNSVLFVARPFIGESVP